MLRGLILGILLTLLAGVVVWLGVAYGGLYNAAASEPLAQTVRWTLDTAVRRSVSRQAGTMRMPVSVPDDTLRAGARHYAEICVTCHGAPGAAATSWSRGMRPAPPELAGAATGWSPEEIAWIVANGIKMSGMPAFGAELTPEEVVAVTAFVTTLPGLSAADYATISGGG